VRDAAVLRQRFLVGFQAREKFDAPKNALGNFRGQFANRGDDAIETETNLRQSAAHLEVYVAGARAFGQSDQILQKFRRGGSGNCRSLGLEFLYRHK
jgi:hypothetical protein